MTNMHQNNIRLMNSQQRLASLHRLAQGVKVHTPQRQETPKMIPSPEEVFDDALRATIEAMLERRPLEAPKFGGM